MCGVRRDIESLCVQELDSPSVGWRVNCDTEAEVEAAVLEDVIRSETLCDTVS